MDIGLKGEVFERLSVGWMKMRRVLLRVALFSPFARGTKIFDSMSGCERGNNPYEKK
jgi:hypothetical protein